MKKKKALAIFILLVFALIVAPLQMGHSATVLTLICTGATQNTIALSWGRSGDAGFSRYELYMSSTGISGPYSQIWNTTDNLKTTTYVDDLSANSSYWFYLTDNDLFGTQKSMPYQASTTLNPTIFVVTTQILTENLSAVNLGWVDPNYYCTLVSFRNYTLQMNTDGNWSTVFTTNDRSVSYHPVLDLSPAYYSFRMFEAFGDSGQYVSYSNIVSRTINPPVQIYINSSITTTDIGQTVDFTAHATGGTGLFKYQWYVNDSPIRGATSANYSCAFTEPGLNSVYAMTQDAQDTLLGLATSNKLTIDAIGTSPQPTSAVIIPKSIYTIGIFSVVVSSLIVLIVIWKKNKN
jgi:hypothetical protein